MTDGHAFPDREHAAERYLLGEMSDADRDRYEEHVFSCQECAEDVRTTAAFLDDVRAYVAPPAGSRPVRMAAVVEPIRPRPARPIWSLFWPLPAGAAVAATLLVAVIGYQAFDVAGLKRDLAAEQRMQSVPYSFLAASRSAGQTVTVSPGQRKLALKFSQSFERAFPFYRCDISDAGGRRVLSDVVPAVGTGDELQILVPSNQLTPGSYTVAITGLESAAATTSPVEPAHYQFTLQRQP